MTYSAPLKVTLRLIVFDIDEDTGAKSVKDIKEQDVFMGDMPLMTPNGTFVVNGTERVIVSQMHRSPGVFFDHDKGKTHSSGKLLFACRIIPYRGSWLDFEFDAKDIVYARIDAEAGKKVTPRAVKKLIEEGAVTELLIPFDHIVGKFVAQDIINEENGAIYVEAGDELTVEYDKEGQLIGGTLKDLLDAGFTDIPVLDIDNVNVGAYIRNTMAQDKNMNRETALLDIYRVMRPGEPPTVEAARYTTYPSFRRHRVLYQSIG